MGLSSLDLWQKISAEGLASPMQCRSWAAEASKTLAAADAADGIKVLQQLIELGKLTNYQAKIIAGQSDRPLHRGPWTIQGRVKTPLWTEWLEVTKVDLTKADQPAPTWARWLGASELDQLKSSAPSLPFGLQHSAVENDFLQAVVTPEMVEQELQVRVEPLSGDLLLAAFGESRPSWQDALEIVRQTATGLAALHAAGLAHGRVFPDRIYVSPNAAPNGDLNKDSNADKSDSQRKWNVTLSRDPLCMVTASVDATAVGLLGSQLDALTSAKKIGLQAAHFLGPEFLAPGQMPSVASDVYALGCTWFWLLTGSAPVQGVVTEKILAAQAEQAIELPDAMPEPLVRCLRHCTAKNIDARFSSAAQLLQALDAAEKVIAEGKIPQPSPVVASKPEQSDAPEVPVKAASEATAKTAAKSAAKSAASTTTKDLPKSAAETETKKQRKPEASKPLIAKAEFAAKVAPEPSNARTKAAEPMVSHPAAAQPEAAQPETKQTAKRLPAEQSEKQAAKQPATKKSTGAQPFKESPAAKTPAAKTPAEKKPVGKAPTEKAPVEATPAEPQPAARPAAASVAAASVAETTNTTGARAKNPGRKPLEKKSARKKDTAAIAAAVAEASPRRSSVSRSKKRVKASRKKSNKWFVPAIGGFGFVIVLMLILKVSGALEPSAAETVADNKQGAYVPKTSAGPKLVERDPRLDFYNIVDSEAQSPWAPLHSPDPWSLDNLPPGGQLFITFHPSQMIADPEQRVLLAAFNEELSATIDGLATAAGRPLEAIEQMTVAFYDAKESGGIPRTAARVQLATPVKLGELRTAWGDPSEMKVGESRLLVKSPELAYFVDSAAEGDTSAGAGTLDLQSISTFGFGPTELMQESAELGGGAGPLTSQLEQLWQRSSSDSNLSVLFSPRYLFSEGRGILESGPPRLGDRLKELLGVDTRAGLMETSVGNDWYWELQLIGTSDREAGSILANLQNITQSAPEKIEAWFVDESPHPFWRSLAFRFPQMLRATNRYVRFGIEDGAAIMNAYLPTDAAPNLLMASWIAVQEGATLAGGLEMQSSGGGAAAQPLSLDEYLGRTIKISFDQEPIEVALRLIGEEANDSLPAGTPALRFALDGDAFEKAGITRNQQLREFDMSGKSVREALTEVAKRGNPVTTVQSTTETDQKLIWVIKDDPDNAGQQMVSLTTRTAATAAEIPLPKEFDPNAN